MDSAIEFFKDNIILDIIIIGLFIVGIVSHCRIIKMYRILINNFKNFERLLSIDIDKRIAQAVKSKANLTNKTTKSSKSPANAQAFDFERVSENNK